MVWLDMRVQQLLQRDHQENYTAPRMVLAASGVDHDKLLENAEPLVSDLPKVSRPPEPAIIYTGGDFRRQGDSGITHFALAFELPGGWVKEKNAIILTVFQMLMGGGESFSVGGPGKGMYSRLNLCVLNEHREIHSFSAFSSIYDHSGLFGIQATAVYLLLARYASTTAVATRSSGFFGWLTGERLSLLPPLDFPLKDVRVVSETSPNPAASIGLYVDCGSIYETPTSFGVNFRSTTNTRYLRIVREVEAVGGNVNASASREHMSYTYDALKISCLFHLEIRRPSPFLDIAIRFCYAPAAP